MYPKEIEEITERFFGQAYKTVYDNLEQLCKTGGLVSAYNKTVSYTDICPTLTTRPEGFKTAILTTERTQDMLRIRKLTPRCCFKLMGLEYEDANKAAKVGVSDSALYAQAGNGIVTNCVELLFEHLYKAQYDENFVCTDENFQ